MGSVPAPHTNVAFDRVEELVAALADENELLAISHEVAETHKLTQVSKRMASNTRAVRERLHDLSHGAQFSPPGRRNYLLQAIWGMLRRAMNQLQPGRAYGQKDRSNLRSLSSSLQPLSHPLMKVGAEKQRLLDSKKHANCAKLRALKSQSSLVKAFSLRVTDKPSIRDGDNQLGNGAPMAAPLIVYATRT